MHINIKLVMAPSCKQLQTVTTAILIHLTNVSCQTAVRIFQLLQKSVCCHCKHFSCSYLSLHGHITSCLQWRVCVCLCVNICVHLCLCASMCVFEGWADVKLAYTGTYSTVCVVQAFWLHDSWSGWSWGQTEGDQRWCREEEEGLRRCEEVQELPGSLQWPDWMDNQGVLIDLPCKGCHSSCHNGGEKPNLPTTLTYWHIILAVWMIQHNCGCALNYATLGLNATLWQQLCNCVVNKTWYKMLEKLADAKKDCMLIKHSKL